jgi:hypothetical protein
MLIRRNVKELLLLAMLLPVGAAAQLFQNADSYILAGPVFAKAQAIGNSGVTLYGSAGYAWTWGFGRQIKRIGGASLWVDVPFVAINPSHQTDTIPGSITQTATLIVPGLRVMMPLSARFTAFADVGGGVGFLDYPVIESSNPPLTFNQINHGVFSFGCGIDFRLSGPFSLRLDVRDYVTGHNLEGVPGPNHVMPMFGFAMHL